MSVHKVNQYTATLPTLCYKRISKTQRIMTHSRLYLSLPSGLSAHPGYFTFFLKKKYIYI